MINLLVANHQNNKKYKDGKLEALLKAQIDNSLELGWNPLSLIVVANFPFKYRNVKVFNTNLNNFCLTGSKLFGLQKFIEENKYPLYQKPDLIIWSHDLDVWQCHDLSLPNIKDVGITTYSTSKLNGGSVFWRIGSLDIIHAIIEDIRKGADKEEPAINKLLKRAYANRTTVLNTTYNVGCSGFVVRAHKADKPIKVAHFSPFNRIAWETHRLDRNGVGLISIPPRLESLLRKHFPHLATQLSEEGKTRREELRKKFKDIVIS